MMAPVRDSIAGGENAISFACGAQPQVGQLIQGRGIDAPCPRLVRSQHAVAVEAVAQGCSEVNSEMRRIACRGQSGGEGRDGMKPVRLTPANILLQSEHRLPAAFGEPPALARPVAGRQDEQVIIPVRQWAAVASRCGHTRRIGFTIDQ